MRKSNLFKVIAIVCLLACIAVSAFAAGTVKSGGMLTSIEKDGTIFIDKIGYLVSPSVIVQDNKGTNISLREISIPHNVLFEYKYTSEGFMIIFIKLAGG